MAAEVLREFLISLGYSVDKTTENRINRSVDGVGLRAAKAAALITAAAAAVQVGVAKMAAELDQLHWASRRIGASVENIQAFAYGISQLGGSAEAARGALEAVGLFLRATPGAGGFIASLGVQAYGTNGQLRDTAELLQDLGKRWRAMPFFNARVEAGVLGIDDRTLTALIDGIGEFSADYHRMTRVMRLDNEQAAKSSRDLMRQFRAVGMVADVLWKKVTGALAGHIAADLRRFQALVERNAERISRVIEATVRGIIHIAETLTTLAGSAVQAGEDLIAWFDRLDPKVKEALRIAGLLAAAWIALNSAFLASPIGRLVLLATTIAALYDDYLAFKRGAPHLIDWERWGPGIEEAWRGIERISAAIDGLIRAVIGDNGWATALEGVLIFVAGRWVLGILGAIGRVQTALTALVAPWWLLRFLALPAAALALVGAAGGEDQDAVARARREGEERRRQQGESNEPRINRWWRQNMPRALGGDPTPAEAASNGMGHPNDEVVAGRGWADFFRQRIDPSATQAPREGEQRRLGEQAMAFFQRMDWSFQQAAGLVAQIQAESNFNSRAVGDHGSAVGILQWHPDRQAAFRRWSRDALGQETDVRDARYEDQLRFIDHELREGAERARGVMLRTARTAEEAGSMLSARYVRPFDPLGLEAARRGRLAQDWATRPALAPAAPAAAAVPAGELRPRSNVVIQQETNINIAGSGDPNVTADLVRRDQGRVNADLVRNMQGAAR